MTNTFEISIQAQLTSEAQLLKAAKSVLADYYNRDGNWETTEAAMVCLSEAIRRIELEPNEDGWIKWAGGPMPVAYETIVDTARACGDVDFNVVAGDNSWTHHEVSSGRDITAFRIKNEGTAEIEKLPGSSLE